MTPSTPVASALEMKAPFRRSPEVLTPIPARLHGALPEWLKGELVRTCPAIFDYNGWHASHWFDGLGMLYAFEIGEGSAVTFRSRLLETDIKGDLGKGRAEMASFGTPVVRSFWTRLFKPVPTATDNANVNILKLGGDLVAMTESDRQLAVDPKTLAVKGPISYSDELSGAIMSAHPQFDFAEQRVVNVATRFGASPSLAVYDHAPGGRTRRLVASVKTNRIPYQHSFGLTPRSAILILHPFSIRPTSMLWSNRGFIDHFAWLPETGTRLVIVDRRTGATRECKTDPFFCFHVVNAFEASGETVLDLLVYPNADIVEKLRVASLSQSLPDLRPELVRLRMRPGAERAELERIGDVGFEFPQINYRRSTGEEYRFVWGAANGPSERGYDSSIVKLDLRSGQATSFAEGDYIFGEPIFVARPGAGAEDEGVILSVGTRQTSDQAALAVLDAQSLNLMALAEIDTAIPLGFHGSFVRNAQAAEATSPGRISPAA
jgi:beta,beta-carotene 9',10'-dioxygenase